jgi:predicted amino acid dehydrogenase
MSANAAPLRIACLSLLPGAHESEMRSVILGREYIWYTIPCEAQLDAVRDLLPELAADFDAVALDGIVSSFRIGEKSYPHEYVVNYLRLNDYSNVYDGSALTATLERHMVKLAADQLADQLKGRHVLFLCGLSRAGSAEVLSGYSKRLVFGDLLYGFRLGIPIIGYKNFLNAAPGLVNAVSHSPAQWYWPSARSTRSPLPRFSYYFRRSDVIVGDLIYFQRYAPETLEGKVIFTTLRNEADLELFRQSGAGRVVSLTPVVDGSFLPQPVLESILRLDARQRYGDLQDHFLNQLQEMELAPFIFDFKPAGVDLALAELPKVPLPPLEPLPDDKQALESEARTEVGKFCFVIHPLHFKHMQRIPSVRMMSKVLPERTIENIAAQMKPFPVGRLKNVTSASGAQAEGLIYAVPMTSKAIMRHPPEFLYRKLVQVAEDAGGKGCKVMGLGAYTSVVGDAGVTVSQQSPIGVTSGNSFTVAATLKTLRVAAERSGIDFAGAGALVIGATGSIGSICARLLACDVQELYLVSPRPERLLALAAQIADECPRIKGHLHLSRIASDFLPKANIIVSTTSAVDPIIDVSNLRPGAVVCDVARPPDIKEEAAASRDDILVIESGEIQLPEGAELTVDIGLPKGTIYACLAETLLLALEQRGGHYTLGREIDPRRVQEIAAIGEKHGLDLAAIRSFGKEVPPEHFERLRIINTRPFAPAEATLAAAAH